MTNFNKVREFHETYGVPVLARPQIVADRVQLRLDMIDEERRELGDAITAGDVVEVADALTDISYLVYGTALEFGIDLDACFAEVHRANMSKLGPDGKPIYREDGKVLKGPNYTPPNLAPVLALTDASNTSADWGWWAGRDEEWFNYGGPFKTRERAIEEGRAGADGEGFYIVEALQRQVRFSAERLIEAQYFEQDDLFDVDHGDASRLGDHKAADAELQALLDAWAEKHQATFLTPNMFANQRNLEWIEPVPAEADA